jgi:hypothetical protein
MSLDELDTESSQASSSADSGSDEAMEVTSDDAETGSQVGDEDVMMDFINWDAAASNSDRSVNQSETVPVRDVPWCCFPFLLDSGERIVGFKLFTEESNLMTILISCVFLPSHMHMDVSD